MAKLTKIDICQKCGSCLVVEKKDTPICDPCRWRTTMNGEEIRSLASYYISHLVGEGKDKGLIIDQLFDLVVDGKLPREEDISYFVKMTNREPSVFEQKVFRYWMAVYIGEAVSQESVLEKEELP